ncbi:heme peroxidase [Bipolaris maydis]|nr:heme peroxidase [Bipolaris maydis]KAJ5058127.1 heme peroxidase [Bipolaris maydis]KAJ6195375.1 heme peroxidase [Bipolaris maydis]
MKSNLAIGLALIAPSSQAYVWPNQYDHIDDLLYTQSGYIRDGTLGDQIQTCDFGANLPGIQKTAEWVRTAFHDSVTHDASTKTGGLDASIQYELDRPENLGAALNNTLSDLAGAYDIRTTAADLLALSLVMSVDRCGGMRVPLRLGRKDAPEAGIKGVPEPSTSLETTRKRFATASLSEVDMITLIACGHSIGGVHSVDHPEIVSGPVSPENKASFDTTKGVLDNQVVVEYLNNSTANPLVSNTNDTLNSDKRIFASDDNKTMRKLADPAYFKSQCEDVFSRMIDLVPGDVTLTEPLQPAEIRPYIAKYEINNDGGVDLSAHIRVRITDGTGRDPASLTASIIPITRNGTLGEEINATMATMAGGTSSGYQNELFQWFDVFQSYNASDVFDSFKIRVNGEIYDNGGTGGYPINGDVFYQRAQTCTTFPPGGLPDFKQTFVAAVSKKLLANGATPQLRVVKKNLVQGLVIPKLNPVVLPMERTSQETAGYVYYTVTTDMNAESATTTFDILVGDSKVEYLSASTTNTCQTSA